jgi:hypothetical protein
MEPTLYNIIWAIGVMALGTYWAVSSKIWRDQ